LRLFVAISGWSTIRDGRDTDQSEVAEHLCRRRLDREQSCERSDKDARVWPQAALAWLRKLGIR